MQRLNEKVSVKCPYRNRYVSTCLVQKISTKNSEIQKRWKGYTCDRSHEESSTLPGKCVATIRYVEAVVENRTKRIGCRYCCWICQNIEVDEGDTVYNSLLRLWEIRAQEQSELWHHQCVKPNPMRLDDLLFNLNYVFARNALWIQNSDRPLILIVTGT